MKKRWLLQIEKIPVKASILDAPVLSQWTEITTNCIVIWRKNVAVVVDPGGEGEKIARFLKRKQLTVGAYWLTHAHPDHVNGLKELLEAFPAPVHYHDADSSWMKFSLPILGIRKKKCFKAFGNLREIFCGDIVARVILTPGHTPGGVCYWFDEAGVLISGDTLQSGGFVGNPHFPGGDEDALKASLSKIFLEIPDEAKVIAGHGETTTIGAERTFCQPQKETKKMKTTLNKVCVSPAEMETAFNKVRRELEKMELLFDGSSLDAVDCWSELLSLGGLSGFGGVMGYYDFDDMDIHVPVLYPAGFLPRWYEERNILDVLRHEFGHALADRYRKFFRGGVFKAAFGASYGEKEVFEGGDWKEGYVSEYATTNTREDFAETFMLYMKYKGARANFQCNVARFRDSA